MLKVVGSMRPVILLAQDWAMRLVAKRSFEFLVFAGWFRACLEHQRQANRGLRGCGTPNMNSQVVGFPYNKDPNTVPLVS